MSAAVVKLAGSPARRRQQRRERMFAECLKAVQSASGRLWNRSSACSGGAAPHVRAFCFLLWEACECATQSPHSLATELLSAAYEGMNPLRWRRAAPGELIELKASATTGTMRSAEAQEVYRDGDDVLPEVLEQATQKVREEEEGKVHRIVPACRAETALERADSYVKEVGQLLDKATLQTQELLGLVEYNRGVDSEPYLRDVGRTLREAVFSLGVVKSELASSAQEGCAR